MAPSRPPHILITGGSRGIGLTIAQLFARNNYRCTLLSRSGEQLKTAVASLHPLPSSSSSSSESESASSSSHDPSPQSPYAHSYIPSSIASPSLWTTTGFGSYLPKPPSKDSNHASKIDVLVNCAGITQAKLFTAMDDASIRGILDTNLTATMLGTRFLLRQGYMKTSISSKPPPSSTPAPASGGTIPHSPVLVNIASLLGVSGGYGAVAYAASKAGVLGFSRALATEYAGHGVRVNAVVPGYVATDMVGGTFTLFPTIPLPLLLLLTHFLLVGGQVFC